jgi:hypothetical protein
VAHKLVFTMPFCSAYKGSTLGVIGCYTTGYKVDGRSYAQATSSRTISHRLPTSFPTAEMKEREKQI